MNTSQRFPWLIVSAWLLASPAFAETEARLVADLAPGSDKAQESISGFMRVGSRSVFLRRSFDDGMTLWVTDGTAEGTREVGVLCPPCGAAVPLGSTGSVAFYRVEAAYYPVFETAIWRSDGTPAGTFPLTASLPMYPSAPGSPGPLPAASIQGGLLFFTACTEELGCELWSSDGSPAGTAPVGEIIEGPGNAGIQEIAATGDRAFLIVEVPGESTSLWIADGRAHTLRRLRIAPEAQHLAAEAGRAFFIAKADGLEVWTSDGTAAGTRPATSFAARDPFVEVSRNLFLTLAGGRALFVANDGAKNGAQGFELWSAGARPSSLLRVSSFQDRQARVLDLVKAGDRIVFADAQVPGGTRLWTSRGDFRTTARLAGCPGGCPAPVSPLVSLDARRIVFYGQDQVGGGIWVTDGTGAGTRLVRRTGPWKSLARAVALDGRALIEITEEYETGELWVTDGTDAGTRLVAHGGPNWSHYYGWGSPLQAGTANGALVFPGLTEELEETLWRSDGSPAGSTPIAEPPQGRSSHPQGLAPLRDGLLVQSCTGESRELRFVQGTETTLLLSDASPTCYAVYSTPVVLGDAADTAVFIRFEALALLSTDGTVEGTQSLFLNLGAVPLTLARFGDEAAFWVYLTGDGTFRSQLWLTDGTPAGTRKQLDLPAGTEMWGLSFAAGRLWFFDTVEQGTDSWQQLWVSDGTPTGTHPATPVLGSSPGDMAFVEAGGRVYFLFGEIGEPTEIWGSDGTPAGTGPAVTPASGAVLPPGPTGLTAAQGRLYFAAARTDDPKGRLMPWVSEGTDGSTELLADVTVGEPTFALLDRSPFVELNGRVWFAAADKAHGDELWSTDGTPEGTARLLDIAPGLFGSHPRGLTAWNGRLWFRARDAEHGMELWSSDGTAEGTLLVHDFAPGASWSTPQEPTGTAEGLYVTADDGEHGRELWVLLP